VNADGIEAVLFDFGGVLAEEGFRKGMEHMARMNSLDAGTFFGTARDLISTSGYLTGRCTESDYWNYLRGHTGIVGSDEEFRKIILDGFILRDWMLSVVKGLRTRRVRVAILSDQTNWLDELDEKLHFSRLFERVFNSYHMGKGKSDQSLFGEVVAEMGLEAGRTLFIDDTAGHIERALSAGLHAIHYKGREQFLGEMAGYFPGL